MKNILESEEVFMAYAQIDLCYYLIEKENEKINMPQSPITKMIDEATGYGKVQNKKAVDNIISCLITIVEQKKVIEADATKDEKFLNELIVFRDNQTSADNKY